MRLEEFDTVRNWWNNRKESEQSWKVSASEISRNNYNLDVRNPNAPKEIHEDPDKLLSDYTQASQAVQELQQELKSLLAKSLES